MRFDNVWRLGTAQALSVASVGGAAASSAAFRHSDLCDSAGLSGSTSSTGGCRIAIVSPNDNAVSSRHATGTELGAGLSLFFWPARLRDLQ
jgi:hypothetical protein